MSDLVGDTPHVSPWAQEALRLRGEPVGVHQALGKAEQAALRQTVRDDRPCDLGLSGQLWTRRLVGELIARLYGVRLTEVGRASAEAVGAVLSALGQEGR